jgi:hypothetical protein
LIAGAGLGGLSAALSLHAAGIEVRVIDEARELRAIGVGIPTRELISYDRFGSRICGEPWGLAAGYRWPQYSIHARPWPDSTCSPPRSTNPKVHIWTGDTTATPSATYARAPSPTRSAVESPHSCGTPTYLPSFYRTNDRTVIDSANLDDAAT